MRMSSLEFRPGVTYSTRLEMITFQCLQGLCSRISQFSTPQQLSHYHDGVSSSPAIALQHKHWQSGNI